MENQNLSVEEAAEYVLRGTTGWEDDKHGANTPSRFVRMLKELTTPEEFEFTTFANVDPKIDEMVVIRNIPFVSLCNHHVIPFFGEAHIAYVPDTKIAGLSKFARTVRYYSKALQVQERLTNQISDLINEELDPLGAAVVLEAEHLCMTIRGAQSPGTKTRTARMTGVFADHEKTAKAEFLSAVNGGKH